MKRGAKPLTVADLTGLLGKRAPFDLAEDWDNVGLLAGDPADAVTGVIVAVNLGPEALAAAANEGANVIVCHHPPIFKPVSRLTRPSSPYLYEALRKGYAVIALHTNFDLSSDELSKGLAARLGCEVAGYLAARGGAEPPRSMKLGKLVTYVPEKDADKVREAVCKAGAGKIGDYTQCSFSWEGEGTFLGGEGANPAVGKAGRLERVRERRLEVVFPWKSLDDVVQAARDSHPYEEMAYDVIQLGQPARAMGYGFIGNHVREDQSTNLTFHKLLNNVKETFKLRSLTVAGPGLSEPKMKVRRIAFSPGSGSSFVHAAVAKGADVYIVGEVGYHQMLEARQKGLTLVILGHSYSERFFVETAAGWCESSTHVHKVFETVHEAV